MSNVARFPTIGLNAARRRFPDAIALVTRLSQVDETFRDLCDDLAACEVALASIETMDDAKAAQRRAECREWIAGLSEEIRERLRAAGFDGER